MTAAAIERRTVETSSATTPALNGASKPNKPPRTVSGYVSADG